MKPISVTHRWHGLPPRGRTVAHGGGRDRRKPSEHGRGCAVTAFPAAYVAVIEAVRTVPRAIGFIDSALPGWPDNEDSVRHHAHALGYDLARLLVYSTDTVDDPIARLLNTARSYDAAAVITPTLEHIGGDPAVIRALCDLETIYPATTYARTESMR